MQSNAKQSNAEQSNAKENKVKQCNAKQSKAKQSKAIQCKAIAFSISDSIAFCNEKKTLLGSRWDNLCLFFVCVL